MTQDNDKPVDVLNTPVKVRMQVLGEGRIKALAFDADFGGMRITGAKGSGGWEIEREFNCEFTLQDLLTYAENGNEIRAALARATGSAA